MLTDAVLEDGGVGGSSSRGPPGARSRDWRAIRAGRRETPAALGVELGRVAAGRSEVRPAKGDRRFGDRAWQDNWLLRRVMQGYLATCETVDRLISDAELDWRTERQARFAASNVLDALAPTNFPWSNPAVLKESIDAGGANLVAGRRASARRDPPTAPAGQCRREQVRGGGNLAVTPGSVVLRTDVFELIHYRPGTEQVHEVPLLFVPPTINKYYILDISPGRSMVEWLLGQQQQVFTISWRNPDAAQGHFDLDTYAQAVLEARDAVAEITGQPAVNVNAACSGGIITACALGHLAAIGEQDKFGALTLMVCALDQARMGTAGALATRELAAAAVAESARKGYVDGRALAGVFAWLRPNDLVWNYFVNNYLLGKDPPAFDILYWNQDTRATRRRAAPRLRPDRSRQRPHPPGRGRGARHADRSRLDHPRQLHGRGAERSHRAMGKRLPQRSAARRLEALRALDERPHPGARQPAQRRDPRQLPCHRRPRG